MELLYGDIEGKYVARYMIYSAICLRPQGLGAQPLPCERRPEEEGARCVVKAQGWQCASDRGGAADARSKSHVASVDPIDPTKPIGLGAALRICDSNSRVDVKLERPG